MSRPQYETEQDRENERVTCQIVANAWGVKVYRNPPFYRIDATLTNATRGHVESFAELKHPRSKHGAYPTYRISLLKVQAAHGWHELTGRPVYLIARWLKCSHTAFVSLHAADFELQAGRWGIVMAGRTDRADRADWEPMVEIPLGDFTAITETVTV